ncbi:MmpS family transport accessory protein [Streptomyces sp. NPDC051940]|uniref:MmpS family transport accessory protein n=1 Tax=Streptomyces sp. NPDC051940 TaxID=3155675 RepID=UPI00343965D9
MPDTQRRAHPTAALSAFAAVLLLTACTGSADPDPAPSGPRGPRISFEVDGTGTADVDYSAGTGAASGRAPGSTLPWRKTVRSTGAPYTLTVVLGEDGGKATCSITVDGRKLAGSSARGPLGRATCTAGTTRADG